MAGLLKAVQLWVSATEVCAIALDVGIILEICEYRNWQEITIANKDMIFFIGFKGFGDKKIRKQ